MKRMHLSLAGALAVILLSGVAFAGHDASAGKAGGKACDMGCAWDWPSWSGLGGNCCLGEPWTLFGTQCSGLEIGGWTQLGYYTEGANGFGTGLFNDHPNTVDLHQAWIYAGKETDTTCQTWDWGFRIDYIYGTDGPNTQAFGGRPTEWDNDWNAGNFYGHAIPQLYVDVAYNDLKVRMGHFYTIVGYEVVAAPDNFFYSHAYTMNLAEPFTHTGVLTEYAWNENITLYNGWTAGWDTGFTANGGSNYLGGVGLQLTENSTLTYATTIGDFGFGPGGSDDFGYSHSFVWDWQINDRWNYVFQSDYIDNQLFVDNLVGFRSNGHILSWNNYLFYTLNDCWKLGARLEWFEVSGNEISEVTLGANYRPCANVVIRPEFRVDSFEAAAPLQDSSLFGIDAIFTF
jgi:hypothetical protein